MITWGSPRHFADADGRHGVEDEAEVALPAHGFLPRQLTELSTLFSHSARGNK